MGKLALTGFASLIIGGVFSAFGLDALMRQDYVVAASYLTVTGVCFSAAVKILLKMNSINNKGL